MPGSKWKKTVSASLEPLTQLFSILSFNQGLFCSTVAIARFDEIVHDRSAWDFTGDDDDSRGAEYMHDDEEDDYQEDKNAVLATKSASRILSLVEGITGMQGC
jgi:hypothetical protein